MTLLYVELFIVFFIISLFSSHKTYRIPAKLKKQRTTQIDKTIIVVTSTAIQFEYRGYNTIKHCMVLI